MSRVGKKPILIPQDVEVKIEGQKVLIKGPKGELSREIRPEIKIEIVKEDKSSSSPTELPLMEAKVKMGTKSPSPSAMARVKDGKIFVSSQIETKKTAAFWGLTRALLANMVEGVTKGYEKKLQIEGLGYRATLENDNLSLYVGFSHPVKIKAPSGIKFLVEKNIITISGIDKELVGQTSAIIRKVRPPEPYKGKGIKYVGEQLRKKLGKKAVTTGEK